MLTLALTFALWAPTLSLEDTLRRADELGLGEDREWRRLLHFEDGRSIVDGPGFFLAEDGANDANAELRATLRALFSESEPETMHTQCRFPARTLFLDKKLGLFSGGLPNRPCEELAKFLKAVAPGRVYLVFASAFLSAPASSFGHTLLRIENQRHPNNALLSTMINFAAYPTTDNPLVYALLGLTGGFPGRFTALPYYVKVQEYSNIESRDLWEYELFLEPEETLRLLLHAWELDTTWIDYYFFTENCSYLLLRLLEIARPELELANQFSSYAIPTDTLKAVVAEEELIGERIYRPAHTANMNARRGRLTGEERSLASDLVGEDPPWERLEGLEPERRAAVLESALDLHKYDAGFHPNQDAAYLSTPSGKRELELLRARGELQVELEDVAPPTPAPPEGSHESARVRLGAGVNRAGRAFQTLEWRGALHDPLDGQEGYVPGSTVEMLKVRARLEPARFELNRSDALILDRIDLLRMASVAPLEGWVRRASWRVNLGAGWVEDLNCRRWRCTAADFHVGAGLAARSRWLGVQTFYTFVDLNAFGGDVFDNGYRIGIDGALGTSWSLTTRLRLLLEGAYHYDFLGDRTAGANYLALRGGIGYAFSRRFSLRLTGRSVRDLLETEASLQFYY